MSHFQFTRMGQNTWTFCRTETMKIKLRGDNDEGANILIPGFYKIALDTGVISWL